MTRSCCGQDRLCFSRGFLRHIRWCGLFLVLLWHLPVPSPGQTAASVQPRRSPAQVHRAKGDKLLARKDYPSARREYQAAYTLDKSRSVSRGDAGLDLRKIGNVYVTETQLARAIEYYNKALVLHQQSKDTEEQAKDLTNLGIASNRLTQFKAALGFFQKALPLFQTTHDRSGQVFILSDMAVAYAGLNQDDHAIASCQKAAQIADKVHNSKWLTAMLSSQAILYVHLHQYPHAIHCLQETLKITRQSKDHPGEAAALLALGNISQNLKDYVQAQSYFQQALPIYQQTHNLAGMMVALTVLGSTYDHLSQFEKAATCYEQALPLCRQLKDQKREAIVLAGLGDDYDYLSQYDQASQFCQLALTLYRTLNDPTGQADMLMTLGNVSDDLGQYAQAIRYFETALPILDQNKDDEEKATDLNDLGNVAEEVGDGALAIQFYQKALPLYQQVQDPDGQADTLTNLAIAYDDLKQYAKALPNFQQARTLHQQVQDADGAATDISNMGDAYGLLGQYDQAHQCYQEALAIYRQVKDRSGEAIDLNALMLFWSHQANPRLAIFYGKQAINVYQSIRQDIHTMDKALQKSYLKDKEPIYRRLAELLIAQGRLPEAEQVLNLLKDQEFFDFVQRDPAASPTAGEASLTPIEDAWQTRYEIIADKVTAIGQTKADLLTKQQQADAGQVTLTPAEKDALAHNLTQADSDLTVANQAYQDFLSQLATEFQNAPKSDQDKVQTVTDATAFEDTLSQLGTGTVALYTIVEPDKVRIVLVTSQTQVARDFPIKDTDLRAKVLAFRQVLQDPSRDPRPLAHDLYTILVGPIEQDLQGAQATTLMWSLDDVLRYLPMAALYDGKQYLVERYKQDVFTPASESRLTETPQAQWNGLGLGVSQAHPGFLALTGVPQELDGVIHDPTVMASQTGALPGTILLDTAFTQQAMTQALEARKYPLVHIASHFDFQPGDETASFLLLGDGSHLSLSTIKTLPQVFQGVDLLTLSACDTADGSTGADGREVEGFAVLAQRLGAKAVIASLWPVADASTPLLMEWFYKQHTTAAGQPKAEALRQAQLALLHGTVSAAGTNMQRAQIVPDKKDQSPLAAPPFTPDPKAPFAHPYYWAPFILIGNWK